MSASDEPNVDSEADGLAVANSERPPKLGTCNGSAGWLSTGGRSTGAVSRISSALGSAPSPAVSGNTSREPHIPQNFWRGAFSWPHSAHVSDGSSCKPSAAFDHFAGVAEPP